MLEVCSQCEAEFRCSQSTTCWCAELPQVLLPVENQSCLCAKCLTEKIITRCNELIGAGELDFIKSLGVPKVAKEGVDFYYNAKGLLVMTKWYHLRRGECCGNDCLHCGYRD